MSKFSVGNLVVYKSKPAHVTSVGDKIEISTLSGNKRVREKDLIWLHEGPVTGLDQLNIEASHLEEVYELLEGESISLFDLAELLYGENSTQANWSTWALLNQGLWFEGSVDKIIVRNPQIVAAEIAKREQEQARKDAWKEMLERLAKGKMLDKDRTELIDVERMALEKSSTSRILEALNIKQTPQKAHRFLLGLGYYPHEFNPYPQRLGIEPEEPKMIVPPLVDEARHDLTYLQAYAIDDENSRDPDDAISFDGERFWVHIADVAALVTPDSEIDLEARNRGANLYLPEGLTPMLPFAISHQLGLGLHEKSPALSVGFRITEEGLLRDIELQLSEIKVQRLSYREADQMLDSDLAVIKERLALFHKRRDQNGAVSIDLPEVMIYLYGEEIRLKPLKSGGSRKLVAEAMIAAGEAVALLALENDIAIPFVHQESSAEAQNPNTLAEMYAHRGKLRQSILSVEPGKHASLGLDQYTRVTSPLRRYSDLIVHQQLRAWLNKQPLLTPKAVSLRIAESMPGMRKRRKAERLSRQHWTLLWLMRNKGYQAEATVVAIEERYAVLIIEELALEIRLRLKEKLELDQRIQVKFDRADLVGLEAFFLKC